MGRCRVNGVDACTYADQLCTDTDDNDDASSCTDDDRDVDGDGVITEADVFEKLRELVEHGYGRLEVVVRDHELSRVDWLKSQVRQTR